MPNVIMLYVVTQCVQIYDQDDEYVESVDAGGKSFREQALPNFIVLQLFRDAKELGEKSFPVTSPIFFCFSLFFHSMMEESFPNKNIEFKKFWVKSLSMEQKHLS